MDTFPLSILSSVVAALLFWLVFSYAPAKNRYRKIRPKVEFDIYEIYTKLFHHIEIVFRPDKHTTFSEQKWIRTGQLTKDDFDLWLQNKCLNKTYQFDEMGKKLIPIGDDMAASSKDIKEKIEKASLYFSFMSPKEILLLRRH